MIDGHGLCHIHEKKQYCHEPGCNNLIQNQFKCINHGAKQIGCKFDGCTKRAVKDGHCKRHGGGGRNCTIPGCIRHVKQSGKCHRWGGGGSGGEFMEGDVFAEEDWGPPIDNSGEKESDDKGGGDNDGDGRRRSKRDSKNNTADGRIYGEGSQARSVRPLACLGYRGQRYGTILLS